MEGPPVGGISCIELMYNILCIGLSVGIIHQVYTSKMMYPLPRLNPILGLTFALGMLPVPSVPAVDLPRNGLMLGYK